MISFACDGFPREPRGDSVHDDPAQLIPLRDACGCRKLDFMRSRRGRLTRRLIGRVSSGEGSFSRHAVVVYWSLRRLLELMVLRGRSEREKEIEILLLRHQLRVLERQVARPTLTR